MYGEKQRPDRPDNGVDPETSSEIGSKIAPELLLVSFQCPILGTVFGGGDVCSFEAVTLMA